MTKIEESKQNVWQKFVNSVDFTSFDRFFSKKKTKKLQEMVIAANSGNTKTQPIQAKQNPTAGFYTYFEVVLVIWYTSISQTEYIDEVWLNNTCLKWEW